MTTQTSEPSTPTLADGNRELEPFENLDRLTTVEMRTQGIPKGIVRHLYAAARGNEPLSYVLAEALLARSGGRVAVFTGIVIPQHLPKGEIDGPIGSCVLAQTLEKLGSPVDVIVPVEMVDVVEAIKRALDGSFEVRHEARAVDEYEAVITIEKLGRNRAGATHTILGSPVEQDFNADDFVDQLNASGRLTVGIGDGGNEVGFGAIYDQARELVPRGRDCGCPCGDGIITATATQLLFPAAVSNFGAYAVVAALALLAERPELAPSPDAVSSAIDAAVRKGCIDGGTFVPHVLADDGIPLEGIKAVVGVMRTIVEQSFRTTPRSE